MTTATQKPKYFCGRTHTLPAPILLHMDERSLRPLSNTVCVVCPCASRIHDEFFIFGIPRVDKQMVPLLLPFTQQEPHRVLASRTH